MSGLGGLVDDDLPSWTDVRLPDFITPSHQQLELYANMVEFRFGGRTTVRVHLQRATSFLVLHAVALQIHGATIQSVSTQQKWTATVRSQPSMEQVLLHIATESLPVGEVRTWLVAGEGGVGVGVGVGAR